MGRSAIGALELVACVSAIQEKKRPEQLLPELFEGLGILEGEYAKTERSPFP